MQPTAKNLILELLMASKDTPISAREAVVAGKLFDISENNIRVALVRLSAASLVEASGRGAYQLGAGGIDLAHEVQAWRSALDRLRHDWTGSYVVVHGGLPARVERTAVQRANRAFHLLGFGELERGLHVRPDNLDGGVEPLMDRLRMLGLGTNCAVFVASEFDVPTQARVHALWDTNALNASYRRTRDQLNAWLGRADELEPDVAARECFLLGRKAIRQVVFDPFLPHPLVDVDLRRAFFDAVVRFDHAGHLIWQRFFEASLGGPTGAAAARVPLAH
ncbi:PaaX family transcriptional regulator C-terminal domain-containing protein [Aquabacterium sp.]|uniref:PaaX family transcriptional regulator C-terminal domain-containing protein n=1 Tax=Aquabacterium sp. TaxID=1872578 RepID=UPI0035ADABE3